MRQKHATCDVRQNRTMETGLLRHAIVARKLNDFVARRMSHQFCRMV